MRFLETKLASLESKATRVHDLAGKQVDPFNWFVLRPWNNLFIGRQLQIPSSPTVLYVTPEEATVSTIQQKSAFSITR